MPPARLGKINYGKHICCKMSVKYKFRCWLCVFHIKLKLINLFQIFGKYEMEGEKSILIKQHMNLIELHLIYFHNLVAKIFFVLLHL